ncbi:hypothetical protein CPB83DRAFT_804836 [Crepidotus variabilis]|uniref:Arrestin-like N-terminal domain-containing protein n=1 Tax=Crepidotus variabilis TaxID=179855 RepID=A0A9P6EPZ0_9AGAR|nr:hypothetical protein CPB83DRAFT_804836 [Crepidotus variabilis]
MTAAIRPPLPPMPPSYAATGSHDPPSLPAYTPSLRAPRPPSRLSMRSRRTTGPRKSRSKEFNFDLKRKGKTFAGMTIMADSPLAKTMPVIVEGQPVKGFARLALDKPKSIQTISVHITGQVITGLNQGEQLCFINISETLWSQSMGDPRLAASRYSPECTGRKASFGQHLTVSPKTQGDLSPSSSRSTSKTSAKFAGKIPAGEYFWDFSIDLPKEVLLPATPGGKPQLFHPPQSFNERHTRASVIYEVLVKFGRTSIFLSDHRVATPFGYIPVTYPPPFPPLRASAYQDHTPLLPPAIDPDGWHAVEPVKVSGTLFNNRTVNIRCSFFLANPLSYTRSTIIPLCLRISCDDDQALALLSSPNAVVCRLRRRVKFHANPEKMVDPLAWRDAIDHSQLAVWRHDRHNAAVDAGRGSRVLQGELHLRQDMKPSSAMAQFRVEYSVVLFPFDAAGFEGLSSDQLAEQPVEIVTAYAAGPRPRMNAPPGYDTDTALQPGAPGLNVLLS